MTLEYLFYYLCAREKQTRIRETATKTSKNSVYTISIDQLRRSKSLRAWSIVRGLIRWPPPPTPLVTAYTRAESMKKKGGVVTFRVRRLLVDRLCRPGPDFSCMFLHSPRTHTSSASSPPHCTNRPDRTSGQTRAS